MERIIALHRDGEMSDPDWRPQIAAQDEVAQVASEMGHGSLELQADWQRRTEEGNLAMFVVRDREAAIASVNLLIQGADEQAVRDEIGAVPMVIALDVKEEYRRKGIASKLMNACEDYVRQHVELPQQIALGVVAANTPARTMYEKLGYRNRTVGGKELYDVSWPEVDSSGEKIIRTTQCLLMLRDLS